MQTIITNAVDPTDLAVNDLCGSIAKDVLAQAHSSDKPADSDMREIVFAAATIATQRVARVGKVGHWCFFCANDDPGKFCFCHCKFPADFRCHGKLVCEPCRQAHLAIAEFLERMFSFHVVERADSRRVAYDERLHKSACQVLNPTGSDDYDHAAQRDLAFHLSSADPWGDPDAFRGKILHAFRVSKTFFAYQALEAELAREEDRVTERAIYRAVRTGINRLKSEERRARLVAEFTKKLRAKRAARPQPEQSESGAEYTFSR